MAKVLEAKPKASCNASSTHFQMGTSSKLAWVLRFLPFNQDNCQVYERLSLPYTPLVTQNSLLGRWPAEELRLSSTTDSVIAWRNVQKGAVELYENTTLTRKTFLTPKHEFKVAQALVFLLAQLTKKPANYARKVNTNTPNTYTG